MDPQYIREGKRSKSLNCITSGLRYTSVGKLYYFRKLFFFLLFFSNLSVLPMLFVFRVVFLSGEQGPHGVAGFSHISHGGFGVDSAEGQFTELSVLLCMVIPGPPPTGALTHRLSGSKRSLCILQFSRWIKQ